MSDVPGGLAGLLADLEAATEGSRALDARIAVQMGVSPRYEGDGVYLCPRYTESVDAALTLVPEGWRWKMANSGVGRGTARVELWTIHYVAYPGVAGAKAKGYTAPLALCIAALRARFAD